MVKLFSLKHGLLMLSMIPFFAKSQDAKSDKKIPDYSNTARKDIPVEFTWKIEDIYPSVDEWKKDKIKFEELIGEIDKASKDWTSSAQKVLTLFELQTKTNLLGYKLYSYVSHQKNSDISNTDFQSMLGEIQAIFVKMSSKFSFISPDIIKLGDSKFALYLKNEPKLAPYKFNVQKILNKKDHILPDEQQKIVSMTGLFSGVPEDASQMLNDLEIPPAEVTLSDGKKITLNISNYMIYRASKNADDRKLVVKTFLSNQKKFENTQATLLNGAIKQHFFTAQVYKYNDCLSARLFSDQIPLTVYTNLISRVYENLAPLHKFMKLKKDLLKIEKMDYTDMFASAVPSVDKQYSYEDSKKIILETMKPLGEDYATGLKTAYDNRWIDIYPNKGKESGAYSGGLYGVHPYIKLNFNGKYDAVSTMAHELGHTMHSYFTDKTQHFANSGYTTFIAEIASTFNENMLVHYLLKNENDEMFKLFLLDSYLEQVRATLYHQVMFAEFELAMHKRVESGQSLTADWLDQEYLKLIRFYYGADKGVCEVNDYFQCGWSLIPHFYMNYYVFQYSTGIIASLALSDMVMKGSDPEKEKYLELLKSGGKDFPIELLKKAGVDMNTALPYEAAFTQFENLVNEMETIVWNLKKQGKLK